VIRARKDPWPWPGDSALDKARRTARSYREALLTADPQACAHLDAQMTACGQRWLVPTPAHTQLDDFVTLDIAGEHVGLTADAVRKWVVRGKLKAHRDDHNRLTVRLRDALDVNAEHREARARRANGQPT